MLAFLCQSLTNKQNALLLIHKKILYLFNEGNSSLSWTYLVIFISKNIELEHKKGGENSSSKCLTVYFLPLSFTFFAHIQTLNSPLRHILGHQYGTRW